MEIKGTQLRYDLIDFKKVDTLGHEQCVEQRYSFYFVVKVKSTQVYFCFRDINRTNR